ncbi:MAG: small subunit ribosomal protein S4 [Parcubacteria group bacterium Gr01-1014_30]|nr:MAG: small subunit ribosomal protein S4 [Parcubacteria group bacterium Gr01-1014_30]
MKAVSCKVCRRLGVSVCGKEKCALKRRPTSPGQIKKKRRRGFSEYGLQLREKQKLRNLYNLREAQFRSLVKKVLESQQKGGKDVSHSLVQMLESRLDNAIFRLGLASSRAQARQLVSHGHFQVNGKSINVPSYRLKKGDVIKLKAGSAGKSFFKNVLPSIKKKKIPSWLKLNPETVEAQVVAELDAQEVDLPVEIPVIFEYYSR